MWSGDGGLGGQRTRSNEPARPQQASVHPLDQMRHQSTAPAPAPAPLRSDRAHRQVGYGYGMGHTHMSPRSGTTSTGVSSSSPPQSYQPQSYSAGRQQALAAYHGAAKSPTGGASQQSSPASTTGYSPRQMSSGSGLARGFLGSPSSSGGARPVSPRNSPMNYSAAAADRRQYTPSSSTVTLTPAAAPAPAPAPAPTSSWSGYGGQAAAAAATAAAAHVVSGVDPYTALRSLGMAPRMGGGGVRAEANAPSAPTILALFREIESDSTRAPRKTEFTQLCLAVKQRWGIRAWDRDVSREYAAVVRRWPERDREPTEEELEAEREVEQDRLEMEAAMESVRRLTEIRELQRRNIREGVGDSEGTDERVVEMYAELQRVGELSYGAVVMHSKVAKGVSEDMLGELPRTLVDARYLREEGGVDGVTCTLCLEQVELGSFVKRLPCNHSFHVSSIRGQDEWQKASEALGPHDKDICCGIENWLVQTGSCPICRQPLKEMLRDIKKGKRVMGAKR